MKNKFFLLFFVIFLIGNVFALTQIGEDEPGSFDVDVGEAEIIIGAPNGSCVENWACSYWADCIGGIKTFKCRDCNNCGTFELKPTNCETTQACSVPPSNGGGSSSGGGNDEESGASGGRKCVENWQCSGWPACTDGKQTRTCQDKAECGTAEFKPTTTKNCAVEEAGEENETIDMITTAKETGKGIFSGITGAFIGTFGSAGAMGVTIFIIAIIVLAIFVTIMKNREAGKK